MKYEASHVIDGTIGIYDSLSAALASAEGYAESLDTGIFGITINSVGHEPGQSISWIWYQDQWHAVREK